MFPSVLVCLTSIAVLLGFSPPSGLVKLWWQLIDSSLPPELDRARSLSQGGVRGGGLQTQNHIGDYPTASPSLHSQQCVLVCKV